MAFATGPVAGSTTGAGEERAGRAALVGAGVFVLLTAGLLLWAKWAPYRVKVPAVAESGSLGDSIITGPGEAPPPVSLQAGLDFAAAYFGAVWPALVAGLVIAAAVQVLVPAGWVGRVLGVGGAAGGVRGALLAVPTMMCSCCAAPVAVGLRRSRASVAAALANWVGNPALNPVVIVFAAFVLPWPWAVLRLAGGVAVVAGVLAVAALVVRRTGAPGAPGAAPVAAVRAEPVPDRRPVPVRFATALGSTALRLLPEYLGVVVALGALRGVLFPFGPGAAVGVGVVLLLVVAGLLLPVPTGGEVAVVAALLALGVSGAAGGALLLTLPALSLPSLLMVRSAFPRPVLLGSVAVVAAVGLLLAAVAALAGW